MTEDSNVFGSVKQPQKGRIPCKPSISLLSLPYELHRQIFTDLTDQQAVLICLRRIKTYFWSLTSLDDIRKSYHQKYPQNGTSIIARDRTAFHLSNRGQPLPLQALFVYTPLRIDLINGNEAGV